MGYEPLKEDTKEKYLKIWTHYAVGHLNKVQLAKRFECSHDTVDNAVKWVADNRVKFESPILIEAAKEALEAKLRELNDDLKSIKDNTSVNWNAVAAINKLIKENRELLWKLQTVIQDKSIVNINTSQITQVIKARDEAIERLTDEQRSELATRIRETINK